MVLSILRMNILRAIVPSKLGDVEPLRAKADTLQRLIQYFKDEREAIVVLHDAPIYDAQHTTRPVAHTVDIGLARTHIFQCGSPASPASSLVAPALSVAFALPVLLVNGYRDTPCTATHLPQICIERRLNC